MELSVFLARIYLSANRFFAYLVSKPNVVKTSLNSTWGAIGPKLSVIHRLTDKHTNSLLTLLGILQPKPLSLIYPELIRNVSHINP